MRRSEQIKTDVVEDQGKSAAPHIELAESPDDFKGAPKSKRDRASQLVQRYGKHST